MPDNSESGIFISQDSADVMARTFDAATNAEIAKATTELIAAMQEFGHASEEARFVVLDQLDPARRAKALRLINEEGMPWMDAIRQVVE